MKKEQIYSCLKANPFEQLSDIVFHIIDQDIASSNFKPGEKLNISKISEELNVSRTPVREALIKLVQIGLVENNHDKQGFYVAELKTNDIINIYFIRSMIESKSAFLCASQASCPNIDKLRNLAQSIKDFSNDLEKLASVDLEFHEVLVNSCGNQYLVELFNKFENKFKRFIILNLTSVLKHDKNSLNKFTAEHNAIINSIASNMPEIAEKEMINHINTSYSNSMLYTKSDFNY